MILYINLPLLPSLKAMNLPPEKGYGFIYIMNSPPEKVWINVRLNDYLFQMPPHNRHGTGNGPGMIK